jgi:hypothetical protein
VRKSQIGRFSFVLLPPVDYMRWEPLPYGTKEGEGIPVPLGFVLRSDG